MLNHRALNDTWKAQDDSRTSYSYALRWDRTDLSAAPFSHSHFLCSRSPHLWKVSRSTLFLSDFLPASPALLSFFPVPQRRREREKGEGPNRRHCTDRMLFHPIHQRQRLLSAERLDAGMGKCWRHFDRQAKLQTATSPPRVLCYLCETLESVVPQFQHWLSFFEMSLEMQQYKVKQNHILQQELS